MSRRALKDPAKMTAGEVNKELERLSEDSSVNTRRFIEAGRGHETPDVYLDEAKATDPLSREEQRIHKRRQALLGEVRRECGPNLSRFPRGWRRKPIVRYGR